MQTLQKSSLRRQGVILLLVLSIACFGLWVHSEEARARAQLNACVANMKQMEGAAVSYSLESKRRPGTMINPNEIAPFLRGGVAPVCLSGDKPYPAFETIHGPRCPNSEEHNQIFILSSCAEARAAVWSAALSHAAAHHLSWSNRVDPKDISVWRYMSKAREVCPIGTNAYPPFILSEGPRCPVSPEHNAHSVQPWRNTEFFDETGHILTNRPLSQVSTNSPY